MKISLWYVICSTQLLVSTSFAAQVTLVGPLELKATAAGKTYQQSLNRPAGISGAELSIQNGNGLDLSQKICSGSVLQKAICALENLARKVVLEIDRPQKIEVKVNGALVVATTTNLPREKGSVTVQVPLTSQNTIAELVKGLPTSDIKITMKGQAAVNQAPTARFAWIGENGVAPETVQFSGLTSSDPDGTIVSYEWNFGDGQTASGSMVSHTYSAGGSFNVMLKVTDNQGAQNSVSQVLTIQSNLPPLAKITMVGESSGVAPFTTWFDGSTSTDPEGQALTYLWEFGDGQITTTAKPVHEFSQSGSFTVKLTVKDPYLLSSTASKVIQVSALQLPPAPNAIAPPLATEKATTNSEKYNFLYQGSNPVQLGANPAAFVEERLLAVKGQVKDQSGNPLAGVKVQILNHPEYGFTYTREDGAWDFAFNAGGVLVFDFNKKGYVSASRKLESAGRVAIVLDSLMMTKRDSKSTVVKLSTNTQGVFHTSNIQSDADGSRKSAAFIPPNTQAVIVKPDGTSVSVDQLTLRVTEVTVGADGPKRMPGDLPLRTAYTWAADFSADEADVLNSSRIEFSNPVPIYVDNFLNIPVGIAVPFGYLNPKSGHWEALRNGVVVRMLGVDSQGKAQLDVGSGSNASASELALHKITNEELLKLGNLYASGATFWRTTLNHFSTIDGNFNYGGNRPPDVPNPDQPKSPVNSCGKAHACVIDIPNRRIRETIEMPGTGMSLEWFSERAPGRLAAGEVNWRLFNSDNLTSLSGPLQKAEVKFVVSGKEVTQTYNSPQVTDFFNYNWDGFDGYGRKVSESALGQLTVDLYYPANYALSKFNEGNDTTFDSWESDTTFISLPSRGQLIVRKVIPLTVTSPFDQYRKISQKQFGGWTLSTHQTYDPLKKMLYTGTNEGINLNQLSTVISTFAGNGTFGSGADGILATNTPLRYPRGFTRSSSGDYYFTEAGGAKIRKVDGKTGIITTIAGTGTVGFSGDGGPATQAQLNQPLGLVIAEDNTIYFSDLLTQVIRKITPDGIITTIAGKPDVAGYAGTGGPAKDAILNGPRSLVLGKDGYLYVAEQTNHIIRRIGPDGRISLFAGTPGVAGFSGDGGSAANATFNFPNYTVMDSSGTMYIADSLNYRIRKISSTGIVETIAGTGQNGDSGDGGPALLAKMSAVSDIGIDQDGNIIFSDRDNHKVRFIDKAGIVRTLVGTGFAGYNGDGKVGQQSYLNVPRDIFIDVDNSVFIVDQNNNRIRKLERPKPAKMSGGNTYIPSMDGSEIYIFNSAGLHIQTLYSETWKTKYLLRYNAQNFLTEVEDAFGKVVAIHRAGDGTAQSVVTPYGQLFSLQNQNDYLTSVTTPVGQVYGMTYDPRGLMTQYTEPAGNSTYNEYDAQGYLSKHWNDFGSMLTFTTDGAGKIFATTREGLTTVYELYKNSEAWDFFNLTKPDGSYVNTKSYQYNDRTFTQDGVITDVVGSPDFRVQGISKYDQLKTKTYPNNAGTFAVLQNNLYSFGNDITSFVRTTVWNENNKFGITSIYDSTAKTYSRITNGGNTTKISVNDQTQVLKKQTGTDEAINLYYDQRGRLTQTVQGDRITNRFYDSNGFLSQIQDAEGRNTFYTNDFIGRQLSITRNDGKEIKLSYDGNSNLVSLTPPEKLLHQLTYNLLNLISSYRAPAGVADESKYDFDKRKKSYKRSDGKQINYSYYTGGVGNGNVSEIGNSDLTVSYGYDPIIKYLKSILSSDGIQIQFSYIGDLIQSKLYSGGLNAQIQYTYQSQGMYIDSQIVAGQSLSYLYDTDMNVSKVGSLNVIRDISTGRIASKIVGNIKEELFYNQFGELNNRNIYASSGLIYQDWYYRDKIGRISKREIIINNNSSIFGSFVYAYDPVGQLKTVSLNASPLRKYSYDSNGNRLSVVQTSWTKSATYDNRDRIVQYGGIQYFYNEQGELTSKLDNASSNTSTYKYESGGQTRSVNIAGNLVEYIIDGEGKRAGRKVNNNVTNYWVYDQRGRLIAEFSPDMSLKSRFIYLSQDHSPDYMISSGQNYYFIKDHLGSILSVLNADSGVSVQAIDYDEFGFVVSDSNPGFQPFGFAGGHYDPITKLTRFGVRDYDAEVGRWTAKDPLLFGRLETNLYAYAQNDPVNSFDPSGLASAVCDGSHCSNPGGTFVGGGGSGAGIGTIIGGIGAIIGDICFNQPSNPTRNCEAERTAGWKDCDQRFRDTHDGSQGRCYDAVSEAYIKCKASNP